MKTLTLSEAFEQATKGPLIVDQNHLETCERAIGQCGYGLNVKPQDKLNAALLAHCFNHMQETAEALRAMIEPYDDNERRDCWQVKQAVDCLAKLNQVQIP